MAIEKKKTYTYAARPSIVEKARRKSEKEGVTLSEKIAQFLTEYSKPVKKKPLSVAEANKWVEQNVNSK